MPSKTDNPTYDTSVVVHKKNDDAVDMHILAERLDNLNTILGASAQGHFRRSLVALDIANPAPLGFFSFSIALAIFACVKANIVEVTSALLVIPAGVFIAGIGMLLAATMELFRRNSLGFNSFALYGLFFTAYAVYNFGVLRGWFFLPTIKGQQALAALMGIASFIFMVASAAICLVLPAVFFMVMVFFFLMAAAVRNLDVNLQKGTGWWGLITAALGFYAAAAFLIEDMWGKEVLPLLYTKAYKQHAAHLFPRISSSDPRSVTAGVPYPGRPEFKRGDNLEAAAAPSLDNLNRLHSGEAAV